MNLKTDISVGEFLDKVSILEIKSERIVDPGKLKNVNNELQLLRQIWRESSFINADIQAEISELKRINETLWVIEDDIRDKERAGEFDHVFIELARAVYVTNDRRANAKRRINIKVGSKLVEEKSYADYTRKEE